MDINKEDIDTFCKNILSRREIKNKLVVLCEGNPPRDIHTPSKYSSDRMGKIYRKHWKKIASNLT
jgi:hypothetical protein